MQDFINITHRTPQQIDKNRQKLKQIYDRLPATKGCMENINAEGGCGAWCCSTTNPQVLEVEFANTWKWVNDTLSRDEIIALVARALRNFLNNNISKGCIFFDNDKKLCLQHNTRPFSCREYGIMAEDEWKPRYEQLKILNPEAREQCNLVSTVDGKPFTKLMSDALWKEVVRIEASNGIPHHRINDKQGGTYRTYHDHILLNLYQPPVLKELSKMRLNATTEQKESLIKAVISKLFAKVDAKPVSNSDAADSKPAEPKAELSEGSKESAAGSGKNPPDAV